MAKFEYRFDMQETIWRRCSVVVEAETLEDAMLRIEEYGPWGVGNQPNYGLLLDCEFGEALSNDSRKADNWTELDPIEEDD